MNERFSAFLAANVGVQWKSNSSRNAAYICFILDMKKLHLGSIDERITDQEEFTQFIWRKVNEQIGKAS